MTSKNNSQNSNNVAPFERVALVGLGLIGGSIAAALRKAYKDIYIFGADSDSRSNVVAIERGWANNAQLPTTQEFRDFVANEADLVIIATPVGAVDSVLELLEELNYTNAVTDTASTKGHILEVASRTLKAPYKYIPGHPMCGSEKGGIDAARSDLFEGANWILCPDEETDPDTYQKLHEMIYALDARVVAISRDEHDKAIAIVSHVPHMVASSLITLAFNHTDDKQMLMRLAAGGFKDTTRIAAGSPSLWCGIAFDNKEALGEGLQEMEEIIASFREALEVGDRDTFTNMLAEAAEARRDLPAAWIPSSEKLLEVRIPMVDRTGIIAEVTTIASSVGCNIQSIDIDHVSEGNAVLSLILTDEGDVGQLSFQLIDAGYSVSFSPIQPKEHSYV